MGSLSHLLVLLLVCTVSAESADPSGVFCNTKTNITNNQISSNIDSLLPQLVQGTLLNGYIATSFGRAGNRVYGLAQCRADVTGNDCKKCITDAATEVRERCPKQADARIWYDFCFLRYDIKDFFGEVDTGFGIFYANVQNVTDPETFKQKLGALIDQISLEAVAPGNKGNGRGKTQLGPLLTLYALVQCTRDLSPLPCKQCLAIAVDTFNVPNFCSNKKGCRVLYSSCYVRYELYPFYFPVDLADLLDESAKSSLAYRVSVVSKP